MKMREKIEQSLKGNIGEGNIEAAIAIAYYKGCEDTAKYLCDRYKESIKKQRDFANTCRYHDFANKIIDKSGGDILYSPHYSQDISSEFLDDEYKE